jgi:HNH endonuclease
VPTHLDRLVRSRARGRCEYCQLPQAIYRLTFPLDHINAEQHGGKTRSKNLALACPRCNRSKGPNIAGTDTFTRDIVRLFNPRLDHWSEHFRWRGPQLIGMTPIGRATIRVLAINDPEAIKVRRELMMEGAF